MSQIIVMDDTDLPVLSDLAVSEITSATATISFGTTKDNGTGYWYVSASATPPSDANMISGTGAVAAGNFPVDAFSLEEGITGMAEDTDYYVHVRHVDVSGNASAIATSALFHTLSTADTTAPVISAPTLQALSASTMRVGMATDEGNGTWFTKLTTSATPPSEATIIASPTATKSIASPGTKSVDTSGQTAATTYYAHSVHRDAAGNVSNIITSAAVATWPALPSEETLNPGTSGNWTVPAAAAYYTVTFKLWGAGGGGGGGGINSNYVADDGDPATITYGGVTVTAGGGKGGQGNNAGAGGGDGGTNTNADASSRVGVAGDDGTFTGDPASGQAIGGAGGHAPDGGEGGNQAGPTSSNASGDDGEGPGGGGGGGVATGPGGGGGGGSGAKAVKAYAPGALSGTVAYSVPTGAAGGAGWRQGGDGGNGIIRISYSA